MIEPSTKLSKLATSVFSEFAARKQEQLALGANIIDLSIGSPDMPPPDFVRQVMAEEVAKGTEYGYTITASTQFKEAVCHYYSRRYNIEIHEEEVLQLIGSQDGLSHLALAYLDAGDVLISPNPGYPIYHACADIAGAELYTVEMTEENQFMPDLLTIPDDIKKRAKLMIVNYPGNPTSALATKEYLAELIEFGLKHNIIIVHDFAYSELIFDNVKPMSIFTIPDAKKIA
ncbi:MAG TPA: aminotransferase class I/II-fold pyridoxal phosphate-dependent enzyme, partial [Bacilli bacterium]|nr:aminotransferase class I/II-fold pyridoxal phosphate-dependent enzyme [Bacilli bacterium]